MIATYQMKPRIAHLKSLVKQIVTLQKSGVEVILVSSGAIVLGMGELDQKKRPKDLASLQALAAVGQTTLMRMYDDFFKSHRSHCAQVLMTWDDFDNRLRYHNARNTFQAILDRGIVPIVNENDTISTEEIKFGDNDKLSSLVAGLVHADLLILLSDVEGLYNKAEGKRQVFSEINEITADIEGVATGTAKKNISRGGMSAKLDAIKTATHANIPCVIANGETKDVLRRVISGERIGTFFFGKEDKTLARQHWISFIAKPKGVIMVDDGARDALLKGGKSLLLPGIAKADGHFRAEDVVIVCDKNGTEIARGITHYSLSDLLNTSDKKGKREVVHCDDMVLCKR